MIPTQKITRGISATKWTLLKIKLTSTQWAVIIKKDLSNIVNILKKPQRPLKNEPANRQGQGRLIELMINLKNNLYNVHNF